MSDMHTSDVFWLNALKGVAKPFKASKKYAKYTQTLTLKRQLIIDS